MSLTLVCISRLSMSLTTNSLCLLCASKSRPSIDTYRVTTLSNHKRFYYQSVLAESFHEFDQTSSINAQWNSFKSSIQKACKSLPPAPRSSDPDWITNEVCNLSRKEKEAWIRLKNAHAQDITRLKTEYNHLKKLAKAAAEKACNAWWSERASEAERWALVAEQQGRGGSLIRDLRLLGKKFFKPASSNLVAKDGRILQSDGDKLNRWAEHFQEVVNCQIDIDVICNKDLPIITPQPQLPSSDTTLSDHDLSSPSLKRKSSLQYPN